MKKISICIVLGVMALSIVSCKNDTGKNYEVSVGGDIVNNETNDSIDTSLYEGDDFVASTPNIDTDTENEDNSQYSVPMTIDDMYATDDFNEDGLNEDKVRIEDFSFLTDKGYTYEDQVELQARLTRYLDYYIPTEDDKVWDVEILTEEYIVVPDSYSFFVYVPEIDAKIRCKKFKNEDSEYPYNFFCKTIDGNE